MKRFLVAVMFGLMAIAAQAEASFDQIEGLIQQKNYAAAASGLEGIIQNHPKSAKAFYAMAQAQAGLGNLEKANKALTIATGLNPTLDFAPEGSVKKLKDAITPQTAKIEYIEESHTVRNTILVMFVIALGFVAYTVFRRNQEAEEKYQAERDAQDLAAAELRADRMREAERQRQEARNKEIAAEAALKAHKNYGKAGFDPANPDKLKTKKQLKDEADQSAEKQRLFFEAEAKREAQARAEASIARSGPAVQQPMYTPQPTHTTVVNNSGGNDMLTGVLIGNMLSGSHHDTTRVVEREVIREVPAKSSSRDSSWDDTPSTSSRSSSWDDTPSRSSSSSSSWDSGSSSSSSSSWSDSSSSSSSDSGSSSSWD